MVDIRLKLPEDYLEPEEREGFLVTRERKAIWAVELDLLNELMRVCKKYDLKIWADGGTMLGAVRHKGFIPWDDDIDLCMRRDQYEKLNEVAVKEFTHPYFWQTEYTDPGSMRGHAQLRNSETTGILLREQDKKFSYNQGIFIDIFPLDYVPDEEQQKDAFLKEVSEAREKAYRHACLTLRYVEEGSGLKRIARNMYHKRLLAQGKDNPYFADFEKTEMRYLPQTTGRLGMICFRKMREQYIYDAEIFDSTIEVPFEMMQIPIPKDCEKMLVQDYGEDWRVPVMAASMHGDVFFDVNKSYKEYIK